MQGLIRCGLLAGSLVACHTSSPAGPDGATPDGGGSGGGTGLHVAFTSDPTPIPATLDNGFTLDSVLFRFDNLKVIGDAGPGDPRTTATRFTTKWDSQSTPTEIDFGDAPTGVYSKVSFQIDGHLIDDSYELQGHVTVAGTSYPFEVEDRSSLSLSLDCNRMLAAGGMNTIKLKLAFKDALETINWSNARNHDGTLTVDDTDPQILMVHSKLTNAISIDNSGPN
ncbi:MAG: hypothetical protein JO257_03110 [Deltaproteobacteria bacterium]|nr:hypothetical protein [Deltaproteobacteria bacterium]